MGCKHEPEDFTWWLLVTPRLHTVHHYVIVSPSCHTSIHRFCSSMQSSSTCTYYTVCMINVCSLDRTKCTTLKNLPRVKMSKFHSLASGAPGRTKTADWLKMMAPSSSRHTHHTSLRFLLSNLIFAVHREHSQTSPQQHVKRQ